MKKQILYILMTLATVSATYGQTILKKKEVAARLDQISTDIQNKDFEKAITMFDSKQEVIQEDNVPKKSLDKYKTIQTTLDQKKMEFEASKEKVNAYQKQYNSADYCSAIALLDLSLNKENSYKETQEIQTKLRTSLTQTKQKCQDNSNKLPQWKKDYQNKEYEKLYDLLDISFSEKSYFFQKDLSELETLQNNLKRKQTVYKTVKDKIIVAPERIINYINFNTLTYEQSENYIRELTAILSISNSELLKAEGNNPILTQEFIDINSRIEKKIGDLQKFSKDNQPLTRAEISQQIFSGKAVSVDFINKNCQKHDYTLFYIYNLDVFSYYKLSDYDTELKKAVFKKTPEYQNHLAQLRSMKSEMQQTTYFVSIAELFKETSYDLKRRGFDITLGQNSGMGTFGARAPKSLGISNLQLRTLPSKQFQDKFMGEGFYNEKLFISVNETTALEIENEKENIVIYFLFNSFGMETVKYKYVCWTYGLYNMTEKVLNASKIRIIVTNSNSGKIYYDKNI